MRPGRKPEPASGRKRADALIWPHLVDICTADEKHKTLAAAFQAYIDCGCTGAIDMAMDAQAWEALQRYRETEGIPIHIAAHWYIQSESPDKTVSYKCTWCRTNKR